MSRSGLKAGLEDISYKYRRHREDVREYKAGKSTPDRLVETYALEAFVDQ
jgi:hypothetical protein